jgi:hypothetical protein
MVALAASCRVGNKPALQDLVTNIMPKAVYFAW